VLEKRNRNPAGQEGVCDNQFDVGSKHEKKEGRIHFSLAAPMLKGF
jgi:hypothetical protein